MKKLSIFITILLLILLLGTFWKFPTVKQKIKKKKLQAKLNIAKLSEESCANLPFVVVIPSYNNEQYCEKNLESVFSQEYSNYRVIYIDDASTDQTYNRVLEYVQNKKVRDRCTLIHNEKNQGALANIYTAVHQCRNDEIVVICDGDDWLASNKVLSILNQCYHDGSVWMTYGQYIEYPSYRRGDEIGNCAPSNLYNLEKAKFRYMPWTTTHLKTFYAGLFKKIHKEDLQKEGEFFPTTYDIAIMLPMLEMARKHSYFIPEVLYIYNYENSINDGKVHRQKQMFFEKYIRSLPTYQKLVSHPSYL